MLTDDRIELDAADRAEARALIARLARPLSIVHWSASISIVTVALVVLAWVLSVAWQQVLPEPVAVEDLHTLTSNTRTRQRLWLVMGLQLLTATALLPIALILRIRWFRQARVALWHADPPAEVQRAIVRGVVVPLGLFVVCALFGIVTLIAGALGDPGNIHHYHINLLPVGLLALAAVLQPPGVDGLTHALLEPHNPASASLPLNDR